MTEASKKYLVERFGSPVFPEPEPEHSSGLLTQEDIFQWHFVIRGPPDTEFEVS